MPVFLISLYHYQFRAVLPSRGPPGKPHFKVRLPAGPLRLVVSMSKYRAKIAGANGRATDRANPGAMRDRVRRRGP